jgi:hypothetical protein
MGKQNKALHEFKQGQRKNTTEQSNDFTESENGAFHYFKKWRGKNCAML